MWEVDDLPHEDVCSLISSHYGMHLNGYISIALDIISQSVENTNILDAYHALACFKPIFLREKKVLGRGLFLFTLLTIYLSEYWATNPVERGIATKFPDEPLFVKRSFLQKCVSRCVELHEFVESRQFFSTLDSAVICAEIRSL
jgi:hypothetical protein